MSNDDLLEMHFAQDKEQFESINKKFEAIDTKLDRLIEAHHKQRGFIAGFSMAFSLLAASVMAMAAYVWRTMTGQ